MGDKKHGNGIISAFRFSNLMVPSSKLDATSSREVAELSRTCDSGLLQTDGKVVSGTALLPTPKGFQAIHQVETEAGKTGMLVTIKFSQDHVSSGGGG